MYSQIILANVKLTKSEKQVRDGGRRSEERMYYINHRIRKIGIK